MKKRITNREAGQCVNSMVEFETNNQTIYAYWNDDSEQYVVYSYGHHWPMYIYDAQSQCWYENESTYSRTTSKHRNYARPSAPTIKYPVEVMKQIARYGVVGIIKQRLAA
jgi:hypothetical protein